MNDEDLRRRIASVNRWYHRIELRPGIVTDGVNDSPVTLQRLQWPEDWTGLRVLDVGTRDGFFAFEAERRGADVVAVDYLPATESGFSLAAEVFASRVRFLHTNLYDLDPAKLGTFDVVLFLGLLYHLPDPIGALRILRSLTRSRLYVESLVMDFGAGTAGVPLMQLFPGASFANDPTNFWGPNLRCIEDMLEETEFRVDRSTAYGDRAIVVCDTVTNSLASTKLETARSVIGPAAPQ
jgi:tRNA (mo5U34)-methyltransferase